MTVAIIAEYNPFHNGHKYQLEQAQKRFPNDKIIVIMSGKYTQRGEIAIAPFRHRKKIALAHGAHRVFKLSFTQTVQAAHIFCDYAVKMAYQKGATKLFFGSESNNAQHLWKIAQTIITKQELYNKELKKSLKKGHSFPTSAANALKNLMGENVTYPNDILGLEYCKSIIKNDLPMKIFTIKRTIDFHGEKPQGHFASASYIRQLIKNKQNYAKYSPLKIKKFKQIENYYPKFQKIVKKWPAHKLAKIQLISEGMENLFKKNIHLPTYEKFVNKTNSRRYTSSRIKRVMLWVLLKKLRK